MRMAVVVVLVALSHGVAAGTPQTPEQQRCLNELTKRASLLQKERGNVADGCLRSAATGLTDRLGTPPQAQTAQACLRNDVRGTIAKRQAALATTDATRCLASPQQLPEFGRTGAVEIAAATEAAALRLVADLLGPDLDAAVIPTAADPAGARCQQDALRRASDLADTWWKDALAHAKAVLAGRGRLTGSGPVATPAALAEELVARLTGDPQGKLAKAAAAMAKGIAQRCPAPMSPAAFPGLCATAGDASALAACAAGRARTRFYQALAGVMSIPVPCDLTDDGTPNGSCRPGPRNVLVILADDLGWADVSVHATGDPRTTIPTPNMDSIFSLGIAFEQFVVQPVCSPTRAELLTGRSAARVGVAPSTLNPRAGQHMAESEVTLAEAFAASGYDTAAVGKWHLGTDAVGGPLAQGFHHFTGLLNAAGDYFTRREADGTLLWQQDGVYVDVPGYTTDIIAAEAVRFLEARTGRPFFLYVPFTAPHNPQQAPPEYLARVPAGFAPERATFAAMTIALDDGVGAILAALDAAGLADDTIVFFASDNGGSQEANNLPLRGGKGGTYDGGVRVPAAVRVPGAGAGTVVTGMIAAADVYPTLLALAGVEPPPGPPLDGADVSAGILAAAETLRTEAAWVQDRYDAYRTPDWKLFRRPDGVRELYDLRNDPFESIDVAPSEPGVVATLVAALDAWNARVGARPSHVPLPAAPAAPSGDVVRTVVDVAAGATGDLVQVRLSRAFDVQLHPGDWLEYDVRFAPGSRAAGFVLDLNRTNRTEPWDGNPAVRDQDGLDVGAGQAFTAAIGTWRRRAIGLGAFGTATRDQCKLMFLDLSPGRYEVSIDNVVLHRFDGSEVVIYRDGPLPDLLVVDGGTSGVTTTVSVAPL